MSSQLPFWQQVLDPFGRVTHDTLRDIFQILLGLDVQVQTSLNQRHKDSSSLTAVLAADKHLIFWSDGQGTNRPCGNVVIEPGIGIGQIVVRVRRQAQVVMQGMGELGFR